MNYNGWWIDQFVSENKDGQNLRNRYEVCNLKFCPECKLVWSRILFTAKCVYYNRNDIPYYGHKEKICRPCKEKKR